MAEPMAGCDQLVKCLVWLVTGPGDQLVTDLSVSKLSKWFEGSPIAHLCRPSLGFRVLGHLKP